MKSDNFRKLTNFFSVFEQKQEKMADIRKSDQNFSAKQPIASFFWLLRVFPAICCSVSVKNQANQYQICSRMSFICYTIEIYNFN